MRLVLGPDIDNPIKTNIFFQVKVQARAEWQRKKEKKENEIERD